MEADDSGTAPEREDIAEPDSGRFSPDPFGVVPDPPPGEVAGAYARPAGAAAVLAGLGHLAAPGVLLWTARLGYGVVLNVEFDPGDGARRRVRLAGFGMVLAGAHLLYHGGIRPDRG